MKLELTELSKFAWFIFFTAFAFMAFFAAIEMPPYEIACTWLYLLGLSLGFAIFITWRARSAP